VFEQDSPSEKVPVVDLSSSSDEEGLIPDTSWDEEFARRLFNNLNCNVLMLPGDSKVMLSDSDEEEEAREKTAAGADAAPSAVVKSPTPTTSSVNADEDPKGTQDDNSDGLAPDREIGNSNIGGDEAGLP
jgi:hypothetical protein